MEGITASVRPLDSILLALMAIVKAPHQALIQATRTAVVPLLSTRLSTVSITETMTRLLMALPISSGTFWEVVLLPTAWPPLGLAVFMIPTMALLLTITILLLAMVDSEAVDLGRNSPRSATDEALVVLASAEAVLDAEVLVAVTL